MVYEPAFVISDIKMLNFLSVFFLEMTIDMEMAYNLGGTYFVFNPFLYLGMK